MSDDIVERLLTSSGPATERAAKLAAVDEIKRLRAELAAEREWKRANIELAEQLVTVTAEHDECRRAVWADIEALKGMTAERDELRALLAEGHAALSWMLLEGIDEVIPETLPDDYKRVCGTAARIDAALKGDASE